MITPRSSVSDVEKKLESQEQPALSLAEANEILNSVSILRRFSKKECQIMAKGLGDYHLINKDTREINKTPSVEENIFTFKKSKTKRQILGRRKSERISLQFNGSKNCFD